MDYTLSIDLTYTLEIFQGFFTKKFLDDFATTVSCFMICCKISQNIFIDKIYIQGITEYDMIYDTEYDICSNNC